MNRTHAAVATLALTVALTGCGGSDDQDDRGTEPLSATEFKSQADKICSDGEDAMDALEPAADATAEEQDEAFRALGDLLLDQVEQIDELTPPADIADDVDAMLDSLRDAAKSIKDQGAAAFQVSPGPLDAAIEIADDLGLTECGS